jgi:hypothetical protein
MAGSRPGLRVTSVRLSRNQRFQSCFDHSSLLCASANTSAHAACSSSIENFCPASIRAFPLGEASIAAKRCFRSVIVAPSQGVNGPHRGTR